MHMGLSTPTLNILPGRYQDMGLRPPLPESPRRGRCPGWRAADFSASLFIDGKWKEAGRQGKSFETLNPATGKA